MALEKLQRPKTTKGISIQKEVGCGHLYVTVAKGENGYTEVFATLGKAGGCSNCQNEILTTTITLGLRYGIPMEEYIRKMVGVQCPNPKMFPMEERCLSCPDAIGKAMKQFLEAQGSIQPISQVPKVDHTVLEIVRPRHSRIEGTPEMATPENCCPDCGTPLIFSEGCAHCPCGYEKCG